MHLVSRLSSFDPQTLASTYRQTHKPDEFMALFLSTNIPNTEDDREKESEKEKRHKNREEVVCTMLVALSIIHQIEII